MDVKKELETLSLEEILKVIEYLQSLINER